LSKLFQRAYNFLYDLSTESCCSPSINFSDSSLYLVIVILSESTTAIH
jgi:hypothetical protein